MTALPAGWQVVPLGQVVQASRQRVMPTEADGLPFVGMDDVESETMRLLGTVPASSMKSAGVRFDDGDVIYGRLRPYLNKVLRPDFTGVGSAEFIVMTPSEDIESSYLSYVLNSGDFVRYASARSAGDRPRVDFNRISAYQVPLPSLATQRDIVVAIEAQLSRLEVARVTLAECRARLQRLRSAILDGAWRRYSDNSPQRTLGELSSGGDYGTSQKATYDAPGPAILRIPNVAGGELLLGDLKFATDGPALNPNKALDRGDFLVVRTNGSRDLIGRAAVVHTPFQSPHFHASYLIRFRLIGDRELWRWIALMWSAPTVRRKLESMAATSAGQYNLNLRSLATVSIPVPTQTSLAAAVHDVEGRLAATDRVAHDVRTALLRGASLRRSILHAAFAGLIR